jgi:hypothetical protein
MSRNKIQPTFSDTSNQIVPIGRLAPLDGISFNRFLDLSKIDRSIAEQVAKSVNSYLPAVPGAVPLTAEILLKLKQGQLRVVFSPEVQKALEEGTARLAKRGQSTIAKALNKATGKFVETGEVVKGSVSYASLSVSAALVVIQAAHMISAADLANTLNEVSNKLDVMLHYRRIDQYAQFASVYYEVQRITGKPVDASDRIQTLIDTRKVQSELIKLREMWREEAKADLNNIRNDPGWILVDAVTSRKRREKSKNQTMMRAAAQRFRSMDYAFRLERLLLVALPELEVESTHVDSQIADLVPVIRLFEEKVSARYLGEEEGQWAKFLDAIKARMGQFEPYIEAEPVQLALPNGMAQSYIGEISAAQVLSIRDVDMVPNGKSA